MKSKDAVLAILLIASSMGFWGCLGSKKGTGPVTAEELASHIRFLSNDLLEGRGVGTNGIAVAELYQEEYFRAMGIEPFFGTVYRQGFGLKGTDPDPNASIEIFSNKVNIIPALREDFVIHSEREDCPGEWVGELIYGGYLIQAPERNWDDIKGVDLKGKFLLVEINEPGNRPGGVFEGEDMTYYGRWTYKFEKAAELGAAGILIIHNEKGAAYGWDVARNSWSRTKFFLPDKETILYAQGWMTEGLAEKIFSAAHLDRRELLARAETPEFQPLPLNLWIRVRQRPSFRTVPAQNIAGIVRAKSKRAGPDRYIIVSAHHDHLGKDETLEGDRIFNGAVDNCSATASMLALAGYYARQPENLTANLVFAAVTAEEQGLLGSDYFARNLGIPNSSVLANVNFEMTNVWGETEDAFAIGAKHSDLDEICRRAAENLGIRYIPERTGNLGYFFRSDQLSFAKAGIPAVWLHQGIVSKGNDKGLALRKFEEYQKYKYHKPADEMEEDWDFRGTLQIIRWAEEIISLLAEREALPQFKPESSFRRPN